MLAKNLLLNLLVIFALAGCGTVAPKPVETRTGVFDSSTPLGVEEKANSGFLQYIEDERGNPGALLTEHGVIRYNALISDYRLKYREDWKASINQGDGVKKMGEVWFINDEHLLAYFRLSNYAKDQEPKDSIWSKTKNLLAPSEEKNDAP